MLYVGAPDAGLAGKVYRYQFMPDGPPQMVGAAIEGLQAGEGFGSSITTDVEELLVGAPFAASAAGPEAGRIYFVPPAATVPASFFEGLEAGDRLGYTAAVIFVLDLQGPLFYVGAPAGEKVLLLQGPAFDLIDTVAEGGAGFGLAVAASPLKGWAAVGGPFFSQERGAVLIFNMSGSLVDFMRGLPGDRMGRFVSVPGDITGDGNNDLVVGVPGAEVAFEPGFNSSFWAVLPGPTWPAPN
jgi:hypothetical protein